MDGRTYTHLWNGDRRIYAIQDIILPFPVGMTQLLVTVVSVIVWSAFVVTTGINGIAAAFGQYSSGVALVIFAGPPVLLGWVAGKPVVEGRTIGQHLLAAARYRMLPPRLVRMDVPTKAVEREAVAGFVWVPKGER